jgi:DNA-binding transcriptional LysR family regulator
VRLRRNIAGGVTLLLAGILALTGCGVIPADPQGTLERATGGTLHAGATPSAGLVTDAAGEPSGPLIDLVDGFAETIDADVEWTVGSEEDLIEGLEGGGLDIAVGGMTSDSPWIDRAGLTRGYPGIAGADGREIVMFVPSGENAMLTALETYLDGEVGS